MLGNSEKVTRYINKAPESQAAIMRKLREMIMGVEGMSEAIKWSQPVFSMGANLIFLRSNKAHVTFGFFDGTMLSDDKGLLEGGGAKMKHQKVRTVEDIDEASVALWLSELIG